MCCCNLQQNNDEGGRMCHLKKGTSIGRDQMISPGAHSAEVMFCALYWNLDL
jgi:hypothetical protein